MGLCNALQTFQTLMYNVFHGCIDNFLLVYLDDLLVFSETLEDHFQHLETVLSGLEDHELYASSSKCSFLRKEVEFLGLRVRQDGIKVREERCEAFRDWSIPKALTDVRSFVELVQYFRRLIRNFSAVAAPLTDLTRKGSGMTNLNEDMTRLFDS